jgi:leucyl aminopeptidase
MDFTIKFSDKAASHRCDCLVVGAYTGGKLGDRGRSIDEACNGMLSSVLKQGDIKGKVAETLMLHAPSGIKAKRILLLGTGDIGGKISAADFQKLVTAAYQVTGKTPAADISFCLDAIHVEDCDENWQIEILAQQGEYSQYQYTQTKSDKERKSKLDSCSILWHSKVNATHKKSLSLGAATARGANDARELGNLPGNICTPSYLAKHAETLCEEFDSLNCSVLGEKKMATLGMGSLLSVGKGSAEESKLIVIEYQGAAKSKKPVVLVGKGITFDTGGISIKPGSGMDEMKFDMCGAASVLGTMRAIAEIAPKINVIAVVAAAENMPSDRASKPGDIVTSMSGKTIEILNTDAEGRLVLCDALTYAERFKPSAVIDVATLTGACIVALGKVATGLYSNNQALADELIKAGETSLDRAWQMPLWKDYQSLLDSNFADVANIGGPQAGSVTAACFLARFAENFDWAHLDIAGTAWHSGANKGATGRPVPMLTRFIMQRAG